MELFRHFKAGMMLWVFCSPPLCLGASTFEQHGVDSGVATQQVDQSPAPFISDFDFRIADEQVMIRKKGAQEWKPSAKFDEPVVIGMLDGVQQIYVVTKTVKAPKAKHAEDPIYPESERRSRRQGQVLLHIVVDEHGAVRIPTVDASPSPEFSKAAMSAVTHWTFEPAKLNGQPVAALIIVTMSFRLY